MDKILITLFHNILVLKIRDICLGLFFLDKKDKL